MKTSLATAGLALAMAAIVSGCGPDKPPAEVLRPVRTVELRYDKASEANRYFGSVQARHEVEQAFRVGGKIAERKVEVGQTVREGDVLAVLDATDYRLAEEGIRQQLLAAIAKARQAESDRQRLEALKADGSVSVSDDEHAQSNAVQAQAAAHAQERQLELARNRLKYTVLRAPRSGVITSRKFEVGQVVAEGQPVVSIAGEGEPEIVVDVPEDQLAAFRKAQFKASLASEPDEMFEVAIRELSPQAAATTRTYRARLKPREPRRLALGATATLVAQYPAGETPVAAIPASALTQSNGQPAVWAVRPSNSDPVGTVDLTRVTVHGYRNDEVLVSGPQPGALIVTAGVQKMAPGLRVALSGPAHSEAPKQAAR
ncbi:MAG TPA: efflux RND transporter periplasmic adaptor subunit [Burkholderiales bacterium]|nr:efflux RND transporter periplasmic adaptor subunit [Burkholderiales bacterium]